jgi:hypothetical protein
MILQTSFLTPPFGFALFYLRSVAPAQDYLDRVTRQRITAMTTAQIYRGAIPYVILQLVMVAVIVAFPQTVLMGLGKVEKVDPSTVSDRTFRNRATTTTSRMRAACSAGRTGRSRRRCDPTPK